MPKGKTLQVVFKQDFQGQGMLIPLTLEDLVPADHPVRTVSAVLDQIDLKPILRKYKVGGTSSYHPRVLLKALVFAYMNNIYSSRKIEEALCQNIMFMWICGMSKPDHNTINRFRGQRLQKVLEPIFSQVVLMLHEEGLLSIKDLYVDGTKVEANANRYTFVWGKSIKTNREKIRQQLKELWDHAKKVAASEIDDDTDPSNFEKIDAEKVKQTIEAINQAVKESEAELPKNVQQKLAYGAKNWPEALVKYEAQEQILGEGRNSYSKTDNDATFMRMKDDHMGNGQLKPAYNLQISTNNQYVTSYSIHQKATDTNTLIEHTEQHVQLYGEVPQSITADAGYGSEQNYQWLEDKAIEGYVKHNQFDRLQHKTTQDKYPFSADKLYYNEQGDYYVCPMGQHMESISPYSKTTTGGYLQQIKRYRAKNCEGCPLNGACHKSKGNRVIEINVNLNRLKAKAERLLKSQTGIEKRKQRCYDVEPVFANIKHNHGFKRFMLRGIHKVTVETGLLALAHNLRKKVA
jgi:transposase